MRSQFNTVAEQHGTIVHKLNLQEVGFSKVEMEVQIVKSKVGTIDAKVNTIEREINAVKEAVLDNNRRLGQVEGTLSGHTQRFDRIEQKVDHIATNYEERLKALEVR